LGGRGRNAFLNLDKESFVFVEAIANAIAFIHLIDLVNINGYCLSLVLVGKLFKELGNLVVSVC